MNTSSEMLRKLPIGIQSFEYLPYEADGRKLIKVGVSLNPEERNLGEWLVIE
jgi:hypothetical protein